MGLDMYACVAAPNLLIDPKAQVDLELKSGVERNVFTYWRKFNHLHGWMNKLYEAKDGKDEEFNLSSVRLTKKDLKQLEKNWKAGKLTATAGFFFGSSEWYKNYDTSLEKFLIDARALIDEGKIVYYYAWF